MSSTKYSGSILNAVGISCGSGSLERKSVHEQIVHSSAAYVLNGLIRMRLPRVDKTNEPGGEEVGEPNIPVHELGVRKLHLICKNRLVKLCHFILCIISKSEYGYK